ncbi:MAG: DNA repair protein RecO [Anaerobiospirillum succiniciproducens]|uniref:DNA repair protein RecO n=1 Tax=Anaerobiospirillum succiniciproducens TaxID=13335 RepID=UPI0026DC6E24|nr:DNA repair protein RecO [Anaerobiospirillum succiniciproducens]MDO4676269.1 DNA repair protein RecO [Anaerobiospirillum succiniciproducens]
MAAVIEHEPCYIYHVRDFQEHSQILEALSLNYGALSIVVNNGKRMNSSTQALFQPFTPLKLSLKRSKGELYFLTDYDCSESGYIFPLPQHFCAVYINELLHHLYKSQNQDIKLFGVYVSTLEAIKNNQNIELSLRIFELTLLESMGYALTLRDDEGLLLEKDSYYRFCFGAGFFKVDKDAMSAVIAQEESLKIAAAHNVEPNESFRPIGSMSNHTDDDSGMMFPKSKVRGRRLENSSSYYAYNRVDSSDAYLSIAMRNGFVNEEYMQRYQDLPHDFMGPVLSGEQIRDIVRCDFVMPDSVKLAKQLTGALIERLLNGKEIVSRRLYREYAQMRNAKVRALKEQRLAQEQDKKLQAQTASVQSETVVNGGSELSINNSSSNNTNDSHATSNASVGMQSYMHTTEEQSGKKPLYFEAYPQAQLGAENDNSNVGKEPTAPVQPVASRGYVSQFNHVHRNVPRDKDDAPDFLTEYLNLDSHVSGTVVQHAVQQQPDPYKENDSATAEPMASDISSKHDHSASKDELSETAKLDNTDVGNVACVSESQSDTVIEEEHNASKAELSESTESCDLDVVIEPAVPESQSDVVIKEEHNVSNAELSDACELENADVTNEADDTKSDRANEPHATESSESSLDIEVSENAISDEAHETPKLDAAPTKRKSRASKASSRTKKESDKQKAEEKKAKQKAALKAKAEKKKELERAKAAAKKEAEKLKAAAKREAEKAKAQAKKEAEKAKAAAKREASKIKEAEKKAAQKAKEAERRAALKERAKAKAIADAEAKEAEIDMEFAHSMLAMIDSGMKKRQRQSKKQSLEE